jgi:beta-phosphoglucomutase-like phosphatase (HAD superfamily)
VLELSGLYRHFRVTVSSEEVARGKPAPDVYLEAARQLRVPPERCAAIEDSNAGVRSADTAGMHVVAIPHGGYPLDEDVLAAADVLLGSIDQLSPAIIEPDG